MQCGFFLAAIWTFLVIQNGVQLSKAFTARQPGYLDFDNLPETNFTCEGKVIGGYYADIETGCQMFHVCTIGQKGDMTDIKFLCLNGTVFDQETRVCERVDEVDCSKSRDFYDLNLDLYNNGFALPEDENSNETPKVQDELELEEEIYDENYDVETEEAPETSSKKPKVPTTTTSTTTSTTTTTTTPRPIVYSSIKPFNIILPNIKSKNSGSQTTGILATTLTQSKNIVNNPVSLQPQQQPPQQPQQTFPAKNVGTHIIGLVPTKNVQFTQTQRPFGFVTTQNYNSDQFKPTPTLETGFKPISSSFKQYTPEPPTSTYKPSVYDPYKDHFFSSTPTPLTPIFINGYNQKPEEISSSEEPKRPVVVLTHHFPTITPLKTTYDEFSSFSSPSGTVIHPYLRQKNRPHVGIKIHAKQPPHQHPYLQQIQHHLHQHQHKPNPTILALQSQQQKVHRLHQEGLEIAEHQIAQIASRNAEISNLRSQQREGSNSRVDSFEPQPSHRETKEIRVGDIQTFGKPSIAIVTSTSSTSSRVQKAPVITVQSVSSARGKPVVSHIQYKPETEYKTELEKLFANTEVPKKKEANADMDLEQLLLAWKLKTNQEVTKEDIEKVFAKLDTSKFKNGQTISLSDIFNLMNNEGNEEETTRVPPMNYDEYTEEDVPYDPFYKDVPKVPVPDRQKRRSQTRGEGSEEEDEDIQEDSESRTKDDQKAPSSVPGSHRDFGQPSRETSFSCDDKVAGEFYADTETNCQLFHICSDTDNGSLKDTKFLCDEGMLFNQERKLCQAEKLVDCKSSEKYYKLKEDLPRREKIVGR